MLLIACGDASEEASLDKGGLGGSPVLHRWIIDGQHLPATSAEAQALGLDVDGDGSVDNQLGNVLAALAAQGWGGQAATDEAIDRGSILLLAEADVTDPTAASFTTYLGEDPQPAPCSGPGDPVCRRHLDGTGSFEVSASSSYHPPLTGQLSGGVLVASSGYVEISTVLFGGGAPVVLDLLGARVRLEMVTGGSIGPSVIAGAITTAQRDTRIYPALHGSFAAQVAADCAGTPPPDCGCASGSTGRTLLQLFDTAPTDCAITVAEVSGNALIQSLFAPDVTIKGQSALSIGFGVTAVQAAFEP